MWIFTVRVLLQNLLVCPPHHLSFCVNVCMHACVCVCVLKKKRKPLALCPWTRHFTPIVSVHPAVQVGTWRKLGRTKREKNHTAGLSTIGSRWDVLMPTPGGAPVGRSSWCPGSAQLSHGCPCALAHCAKWCSHPGETSAGGHYLTVDLSFVLCVWVRAWVRACVCACVCVCKRL